MAKFLKISNTTILGLDFLVSLTVKGRKFVGKPKEYFLELQVHAGAAFNVCFFQFPTDTLQQAHYLKMRIPQVCIKDGEFYEIYYDEKNKYWDVKVCQEVDFRDFENITDPDADPDEEVEKKEKETFTRQ